jgi:tetratricopeptide (TPR) repeat protein
MRAVADLARLLVPALLALLLAVAPASVFAQSEADRMAIDELFAELAAAPDQEAAHEIDQKIWAHWTAPDDPILAGRMREVLVARQFMDFPACIRLLDALVVDYPTYAEAWNQRATIHYMMDDFEASLADIDKVLEFEPRHFGALSGRAMIYLAQGKRQLALRDIATALKFHPFLNERQLFPELMQDKVRI